MIPETVKVTIGKRVLDYASRLRFPRLLALTGLVFLVDLFFPDALPFVDEILLGLITLLLASVKRRRDSPGDQGDPS